MLAKNCTISNLQDALDKINKSFNDNVKFKSIDNTSRGVRFTLTVKDSRGEGSRIGFTGKRVCAACWHVHGEFFDTLFEFAPDAVIKANDKIITLDDGNWQDWNIGSTYNPLYYSEACDC